MRIYILILLLICPFRCVSLEKAVNMRRDRNVKNEEEVFERSLHLLSVFPLPHHMILQYSRVCLFVRVSRMPSLSDGRCKWFIASPCVRLCVREREDV